MRPLTIGVLASVAAAPEHQGSLPPASATGDSLLESQIDLRSGRDLAAAVVALGHQVRWIPVDENLDLTLRQNSPHAPPGRNPVDACILALHGRRGGAGDVQALLSVREIPYFGPRGLATQVAFDKVRARHLLAYHNLPVAPALVLGGQTGHGDRALELLGWPCFVKPRRGALGQGVALLDSPAAVREALEQANAFDEELVLERAFAGREVQVVVLHGRVVGSAEILEHAGAEGGAELICPPRMSRGRLDGVHILARRAAAALGLEDGPCRVDVLVNERHNEVILEVEPLPPLHQASTTTRVLRAAGMSLEGLVSTWLEQLRSRAVREATHESRPHLQ